MKFRAVVYDKENESFWKFSQLKSDPHEALSAGIKIAKKYRIEKPDIVITEDDTK